MDSVITKDVIALLAKSDQWQSFVGEFLAPIDHLLMVNNDLETAIDQLQVAVGLISRNLATRALKARLAYLRSLELTYTRWDANLKRYSRQKWSEAKQGWIHRGWVIPTSGLYQEVQ